MIVFEHKEENWLNRIYSETFNNIIFIPDSEVYLKTVFDLHSRNYIEGIYRVINKNTGEDIGFTDFEHARDFLVLKCGMKKDYKPNSLDSKCVYDVMDKITYIG